MVRLSKQTRKRAVSRKSPSISGKKTGPMKMKEPFKQHANALTGDEANTAYIAKIK